MEETRDQNRVAYYFEMGTGKTFIGAEKMKQLGTIVNLVVCQKSKIDDWVNHFREYYAYNVYDLTKIKQAESLSFLQDENPKVGVINYDLVYRRPVYANLRDFTLMLDESSIIQNERAKRSKFILKMHPDNVILLSGTPVSGKYEHLWSQIHLLGWPISKKLYNRQYIITELMDFGGMKVPVVTGYKNVDRLKHKLSQYGALFMKSEEAFELPDQQDIPVKVPVTSQYKRFMKDRIITVEDQQLIGDMALTKRLYARQLCGQFNAYKLQAFKDLLDSTEDRLIVFYNYNGELDKLKEIVGDRPLSEVNGHVKDLTAYEEKDNSVTLVQYQAGAKGLNLQKANKIVYFTLTDKCEDWMQSKKRIHRIGQNRPCFYYYLLCRGSVEMDVLRALQSGRDYTDELFRKEYDS